MGIRLNNELCYLLFSQEQGSHPTQCLCTVSSLLVCADPHMQRGLLQPKVTTMCPEALFPPGIGRPQISSLHFIATTAESNAMVWAKDLHLLGFYRDNLCWLLKNVHQ